MSSNTRFAIGVTIVAVLIFVAAFLPWGSIRGTPNSPLSLGGLSPFQGMEMTFTITGWNGSTSLGGLSLPNWLVVLAAAGVAVLGWLKATDVWAASSTLSFALAGYGLLHAALTCVVLVGAERSSAGAGAVLTAAAFIGMITILTRQVLAQQAAGRWDRLRQPSSSV